LRYTDDPLGDLEAERYDPLIAAVFEDSGLRPRGVGSPASLANGEARQR
jgi:hypothetical protein